MLTIIIPTFNRSEFLIRLLNYYIATGCRFQIIVGDSSQGEHLAKTQSFIPSLKGELNIQYFECPNLTEPQTTAFLVEKVQTPYLAWVADDDFLVTRALEECVTFLENSPNYSVALGKGILIDIGPSGAYGEIIGQSPYNIRAIEAETGQKRILDHLDYYSNSNFGVHRTKLFRVAYSRVKDLPDKGFTELLPNCISTVQGKVKSLDCFYLVRQTHQGRYFLPTLFDWITGPNWRPSYEIYLQALSQALVESDGLSLSDAQGVAKQALWAYLANGLQRKYKGKYDDKKKQGMMAIKEVAKRLPIIKSTLIPLLRNTRKTANPLRRSADFIAVAEALREK